MTVGTMPSLGERPAGSLAIQSTMPFLVCVNSEWRHFPILRMLKVEVIETLV